MNFKRKKKNPSNPVPSLSMADIEAAMHEAIMASMKPTARPTTSLMDEMLGYAKDRTDIMRQLWTIRSEQPSCKHDTFDGILITSMTPDMAEMIGLNPAGKYLGLSVVNECTRTHEMGIYDLESLRTFVNTLATAIDIESHR